MKIEKDIKSKLTSCIVCVYIYMRITFNSRHKERD